MGISVFLSLVHLAPAVVAFEGIMKSWYLRGSAIVSKAVLNESLTLARAVTSSVVICHDKTQTRKKVLLASKLIHSFLTLVMLLHSTLHFTAWS